MKKFLKGALKKQNQRLQFIIKTDNYNFYTYIYIIIIIIIIIILENIYNIMCKQAEKKKQHHQMYLKLNNAEN